MMREKIFSEKVGPLRKYEVLKPEEKIIEDWVKGVSEIYEALNNGEVEELENLMRGGNYKMSVKDVLKKQNLASLNEEQKILLATTLWTYREQNAWRGKGWKEKLPYLWRFAKGGEVDMSQFVKKEWVPNCIDSALLVHVLAEKMGVSGSVKRVGEHHRYWQSDAGDVVDVWWGYRRGGVFTDQEEYQTRAKEKQSKDKEKHSCGSRWEGESGGSAGKE